MDLFVPKKPLCLTLSQSGIRVNDFIDWVKRGTGGRVGGGRGGRRSRESLLPAAFALNAGASVSVVAPFPTAAHRTRRVPAAWISPSSPEPPRCPIVRPKPVVNPQKRH
jgi:hypothetical protein